jgi:hypothetical protein
MTPGCAGSTTDPVVTLEVTHGTLLAPLVNIDRP